MGINGIKKNVAVCANLNGVLMDRILIPNNVNVQDVLYRNVKKD